jgi:hypothetical protein
VRPMRISPQTPWQLFRKPAVASRESRWVVDTGGWLWRGRRAPTFRPRSTIAARLWAARGKSLYHTLLNNHRFRVAFLKGATTAFAWPF